jgi:hypothetical protein
MTTPADQTPAECSQDPALGSSPVKARKNVAPQDRKGVQVKIVPGLLQDLSQQDFRTLIRGPGPHPRIRDHTSPELDIVSYLNDLSDAVHRQDNGK